MTPADFFADMTRDGDVALARLDHFADATPDRLYLHYGEDGVELTFAETRARVDRIAAGLAGQGVAPGDRVAVLTRNSLVATLAMFAIWRAGAVYAPINFNLVGRLLAYQLSDAAPTLVLTDPAFLETLESVAGEAKLPPVVLHVPAPGDHDHKADARTESSALTILGALDAIASDAPPPRVPLGPYDPAAIIYTSGTTGPAKGVELGHRWINQYTYGSRALGDPEEVIYCDLPLYHVGGAFHLVVRGCWMGQKVGLWDRFSPTEFWDRIAACGATSATLLDVMIPWLMSQPPRADDRENTLARIHMQPYSARHHAFAERFGIEIFTVGFGQTESGLVFAGVIDEFPGEEIKPEAFRRGGGKSGLIERAAAQGRAVFDGRADLPKGVMGCPVDFYEAAVLDETDSPVAPGEVGQLCLRPRFPGFILKGYINKPEATLKALSNCWFHTGDAVRVVDAERNVFAFVDRMGGFFRVRGENVSSFEVETGFTSHPAVRAAAAVPIPPAEGEEDDIAVFVELEDGAVADEAALRAHAEAQLPRYMRPRHLRIVKALPVTPTSKIEKYKLKTALMDELAKTEARA